MAETEIDNEEIVYKVTQRSLLYLWCGDILPAGLLLFLSTEIFMSYSPISITLICVGVALFIVGAYFLLESLAFNELIIYKDRVLIDKYILGKHIINIDDIKRIDMNGGLAYQEIDFVGNDGKTFSMLKYSITALSDKDTYAIQKIIKNLKQEKDDGNMK